MTEDFKWSEDDRPLPEDDAIREVHPTRSKRHDLYSEAMRLIGAKRSKYALVDLVNWLLHKLEKKNMEERTVFVLTGGGEVLDVFLVPTAHVTKRDLKEIHELAGEFNQQVKVFTKGWMGIEALKWEIKEKNNAGEG